MTDLTKRYRQILDEAATMFSELMEKQGEWTSDYTLWATEWEAWQPSDMLYILEKYEHFLEEPEADDIKYKETRNFVLSELRSDVQSWLDYNVDVAQFGIKYINLKSWLSGAPRMSQEQIDHLRELRDNFRNTCEEYQAEYGKVDTNPQPKHLRTLKDKKK